MRGCPAPTLTRHPPCPWMTRSPCHHQAREPGQQLECASDVVHSSEVVGGHRPLREGETEGQSGHRRARVTERLLVAEAEGRGPRAKGLMLPEVSLWPSTGRCEGRSLPLEGRAAQGGSPSTSPWHHWAVVRVGPLRLSEAGPLLSSSQHALGEAGGSDPSGWECPFHRDAALWVGPEAT